MNFPCIATALNLVVVLCLVQGKGVMKIPKDIQIPLIVFSLQAVLLFGCAMIFLVLRPH